MCSIETSRNAKSITLVFCTTTSSCANDEKLGIQIQDKLLHFPHNQEGIEMSTATDEATLRSWTERTEELKKDLVLGDTEDWQVGRMQFSGKEVLIT